MPASMSKAPSDAMAAVIRDASAAPSGDGPAAMSPLPPVDALAGADDGGPATPIPITVTCKEARLCDNFESYPVGMPPGAPWILSPLSGGATLVVDGTKAFSGTKAILVKTPGGVAGARMRVGAPVLPLPDNDMYGRMMVWLTDSPVGAVHWNNIIASGALPGGTSSIYAYGAMYRNFMANYQPNDCAATSKTPFPTGHWSCLQWQFDGSKDPATGMLRNTSRLWMDGVSVGDQTVVKFAAACVGARTEWIAPIFTTLSVGWTNYQTSIPISMWIDDVAIGDKMIPCPAAKAP